MREPCAITRYYSTCYASWLCYRVRASRPNRQRTESSRPPKAEVIDRNSIAKGSYRPDMLKRSSIPCPRSACMRRVCGSQSWEWRRLYVPMMETTTGVIASQLRLLKSRTLQLNNGNLSSRLLFASRSIHDPV